MYDNIENIENIYIFFNPVSHGSLIGLNLH